MTSARSRADLLSFLDYAKAKGLLNSATAESRKAAVNKVLGILDEEEARDVSTLDVDLVLDRFQTLHGRRYSPASLRTYRARVRSSIDDFIRYQSNPMDFRPRSAGVAKTVSPNKKVGKPQSERQSASTQEPVSRTAPTPAYQTSTFPIPLRQDLTVLLHGLPHDLTEVEARKIANVVLAMALPTSAPE